jgi:hypothetical protein
MSGIDNIKNFFSDKCFEVGFYSISLNRNIKFVNGIVYDLDTNEELNISSGELTTIYIDLLDY